MPIDRNGTAIKAGDRVYMTGIVKLVSPSSVTVQWDHPERDISSFVMAPGTLEVQVE